MSRIRYLFFALSIIGSGAQASGLCEQVTAMLGQPDGSEQSLTLEGVGASACTRSLDLTGASALNCAWDFPFRTGEARAEFDKTFVLLQSCFGPKATSDQPVNHPDFYDLRIFETGRGEVGLSLKDKGVLQRTYIFLRIAPTL